MVSGMDPTEPEIKIDQESLNARFAENKSKFAKELRGLINSYSIENGSNTPDFILAEYMMRCLETFNHIVTWREKWYSKDGVGENAHGAPCPLCGKMHISIHCYHGHVES